MALTGSYLAGLVLVTLFSNTLPMTLFRRNAGMTSQERPQWYIRGPPPPDRAPPGHVDTTGNYDLLENQGQAPYVHLVEGDIRQRLDNLRDTGRGRFQPAEAVAGYSSHDRGSPPPSQTALRPMARNSVIFPHEQIWTDRIIPYVLDTSFSNAELHVIQSALAEVTGGSGSCVTFVPRSYQADFLYLTNKYTGCWSDVGRAGGNQTVSIATDCAIKGVVMHELLHALGFWHEHNRMDRNNFITVMHDNIQIDHIDDFNINSEANLLNVSYDYYSVMHYRNNTFSVDKSKLATIKVKDPRVNLEEVGQRKYLSEKDKQRIRLLYNCPLTKCMYPSVFSDGEVVVKDTSVGATITYTCTNPGHVLVGASERTCLYDGSWSGSTPLCFNTPTEPSYCSFDEVSVCGWSQDTTDQADWTRWCGTTNSDKTGPMFDHTQQNSHGYYMYLEGTGLEQGAIARLESPTYQFSTNVCILFWYNMYGRGMGNITVYIRTEGTEKQVKQIAGNQNQGWKMDMVVDLNPTSTFTIVFEAVRGAWPSDIAIDDVMIGDCDEIATYENAVQHENPSG